MKRRKIFRILLIMVVAGGLTGGGIGLYMYFMPQRDIQKLPADYQVASSDLVAEFLNDINLANSKYLSADGESKILEIQGKVSRIAENFNGDRVLLLKDDHDKAGVNVTFTQATNNSVDMLAVGDVVTIKGVIRSGAYFDPDLDMYIHATVEKSDIVNKLK